MEKKFYGDNRQHFSILQKIDMRLWFFKPSVLFSQSARIFLPREFLGKNTSFMDEIYANRPFLSIAHGSELIEQAILNNEPMLFGRFGDTELFACCDYDIRHRIAEQNFYRLQANSGYFYNEDKKEEGFFNTYMDAFKNTDALGCWFTIGEDYMIKKYNPYINVMPLQTYEPWHNPQKPWSRSLKGKKVLVVSPFVNTIELQYSKREKLFEGTDILPEFNLITLKAVNTRGDAEDSRFSNWFEALDYMINQIKEIDFDIAIAGCGAYTLPICAAVKKLGKTAIQMGGATQLLFGVIGNRWERDPVINTYRNEYWQHVLPADIAKGMNKANNAYV